MFVIIISFMNERAIELDFRGKRWLCTQCSRLKGMLFVLLNALEIAASRLAADREDWNSIFRELTAKSALQLVAA